MCWGENRSTAVTFGLAGHQLIAHLAADTIVPQKGIYPRHFGLVLTLEEEWQAMADRAKDQELTFYQQPRRRFADTRIEHLTFFLEDPSENLLEFKYYLHESAIFGERDLRRSGMPSRRWSVRIAVRLTANADLTLRERKTFRLPGRTAMCGRAGPDVGRCLVRATG